MIVRPPDNFIVYDYQNLADFGVRVSGDKTFGAPERDFEEVEVPGKSGSLTFDKGRFKNYTVEYEASILGKDERDFQTKIDALRSFLMSRYSYKRLEDTYHPEEFRLAKYVGGFDPEVIMMQGSNFTLEFDCKPQRFYKSGEFPITVDHNTILYNYTYYEAKPIIRVYGYGTLNFGTMEIVITDHSEAGIPYIDIDSDMKDCAYDGTNCNPYVEFRSGDLERDFPVLLPGETSVSFIDEGNHIEKVEITPRWYTI